MGDQRLSTSNAQRRAEDTTETPDPAVAQASYNEITEIEERCTDRLKSNDPDKLKDVGLNVNLHTDLLQAYYRYFLLSNKLGDTGLPATHSMLSRMWQRIQSFVEFLLPSIPHLRDYLCEFLSTAIDVAQQLLKELPAREIILMEILGDLCRFKMGIDLSKGAEWAASSRRWYGKISDKNPEIGRLYHHHAVTAGLTQLNKLFYISKALTSTERFSKAYDSAPVVFKRLLADEEVHGSDPATLRKFVKIHALFLSRAKIDYHLVGEFCGELDSHIQVVGNTFREQGVHIVLANIAAIFDFGDIGALITSMSAIQQTKAKMNDAASHYWNRRRQEGFISWNFRRASFASNLTFSTLGALLQRAGDQNVLPSVHISLAFLWCATLVPRCMEHLQADIPWSKLAFFLNSLVKPDTDIAKLASEEFPTHQNGSRKQLPEDYSLRGFAWAQLYYPDEFWNEIEDYDNRDDEFSSATMSRELCCLWLGLRIAKLECWIKYNDQERSFSTTQIPTGALRSNSMLHFEYLQCPACYNSEKQWKVLGCGHMICDKCIKKVNSGTPLFDSPCPCCKKTIDSCKDVFPDLV